MRTLLSWLLAVPFAILVVLFAVSNQQSVTLSLFPLPFEWDAPLYLAPLMALVVGFVWGGTSVWLADHKLRKRVREEKKHAAGLKEAALRERERADAAERRLDAIEAGAAQTAPERSLEAPSGGQKKLPADAA